MGNFRIYDQPCRYDTRVAGRIEPEWVDWFDGLMIIPIGISETLLTGVFADQAALHGMLAVIRQFKLPLLSLHRQADHQGMTAARFNNQAQLTNKIILKDWMTVVSNPIKDCK
jgi:hypothetical protein